MECCGNNNNTVSAEQWELIGTIPAMRYLKDSVDYVYQLYERFPMAEHGAFAFVYALDMFYSWRSDIKEWIPVVSDPNSYPNLDFLPLSGGTMRGTITMPYNTPVRSVGSSETDYAGLKFYKTGSTNGDSINLFAPNGYIGTYAKGVGIEAVGGVELAAGSQISFRLAGKQVFKAAPTEVKLFQPNGLDMLKLSSTEVYLRSINGASGSGLRFTNAGNTTLTYPNGSPGLSMQQSDGEVRLYGYNGVRLIDVDKDAFYLKKLNGQKAVDFTTSATTLYGFSGLNAFQSTAATTKMYSPSGSEVFIVSNNDISLKNPYFGTKTFQANINGIFLSNYNTTVFSSDNQQTKISNPNGNYSFIGGRDYVALGNNGKEVFRADAASTNIKSPDNNVSFESGFGYTQLKVNNNIVFYATNTATGLRYPSGTPAIEAEQTNINIKNYLGKTVFEADYRDVIVRNAATGNMGLLLTNTEVNLYRPSANAILKTDNSAISLFNPNTDLILSSVTGTLKLHNPSTNSLPAFSADNTGNAIYNTTGLLGYKATQFDSAIYNLQTGNKAFSAEIGLSYLSSPSGANGFLAYDASIEIKANSKIVFRATSSETTILGYNNFLAFKTNSIGSYVYDSSGNSVFIAESGYSAIKLNGTDVFAASNTETTISSYGWNAIKVTTGSEIACSIYNPRGYVGFKANSNYNTVFSPYTGNAAFRAGRYSSEVVSPNGLVGFNVNDLTSSVTCTQNSSIYMLLHGGGIRLSGVFPNNQSGISTLQIKGNGDLVKTPSDTYSMTRFSTSGGTTYRAVIPEIPMDGDIPVLYDGLTLYLSPDVANSSNPVKLMINSVSTGNAIPLQTSSTSTTVSSGAIPAGGIIQVRYKGGIFYIV